MEPDRQPPSPTAAASPKRRRTDLFYAFAMAMELPFILIGGVLIGGLIGWWIDSRLHSFPLLTLLLGLLGFAGGVREVLRRLPKDDQRE